MLHMMPQVIEEETSDEDNSSKSNSDKAKTDSKNTPVNNKDLDNFKSGQIDTVNLNAGNLKDNNINKEKRTLKPEKRNNIDNNLEEEKIPQYRNSDSFYDIRENYDSIREQRSGS